MRLHRLPGLLALLTLALPATAEVYKYYDKDGNLVLSDVVPGDRAEKVEKITPRPVMTVPALNPDRLPRQSRLAERPAVTEARDYEIVIQSPGAEADYRTMEEAIPIAFSITPSLKEGHRLETLLDGEPVAGESIAPEPLGRGTHTLEIRVADAEGKVLKQSSVVFHIQQPTALGPLRKPKPTPKNDKK